MAARLSTEEVIDKLFSDDDSSHEKVEEVEIAQKTKKGTLSDQIKTCLANLPLGSRNKNIFLDSAVELLIPLYDFVNKESRVNVYLDSTPIHAGTLFQEEARVWLQAIYRRLSSRRSIRTPFYAEIHRSIPGSIFKVLVRLVRHHNEFGAPFCIYSYNRKAEVISFTSLRLVRELFSLMSGLTSAEVLSYFKKNLGGMKTGHRVFLIVDDSKDFSFMYKIKKGELTVGYHFGEWNTCGVPQHN